MDGDDPRSNSEVFNIAANILSGGGTIIMFPEAGHDEGHYISYFRKGFARIAFQAEEQNNFNLNVNILPVANHYSGYFNMREKLTMVVGNPIPLKNYEEEYRENPKKAMAHLARSMETEVKNLMLNIPLRGEEYTRYNFLRQIYERRFMKQRGWKESYFPNSLKAAKLIVARLEELRQAHSDKMKRLLSNASEMMEECRRMRLRPWLFERQPTSWGLRLRSAVWILLFPLYVVVYLLNVLPFTAPYLINRNVKDVMLHSSFAFGLGTLFTFPITYLIYALIVELYTHSILQTLLFLMMMPVGLLFFWSYRKTLIKLRGQWRYHHLNKEKDKRFLRLKRLYQQTIGEL